MVDTRSREREVLVLFGKGLTPHEISHSLHRSINTIATHRKRILKKLGVRTSAAAVRIAVERGLVSPSTRISQEEDPLARAITRRTERHD
jgi:DNA-binding NarL/FixJ family response regulator